MSEEIDLVVILGDCQRENQALRSIIRDLRRQKFDLEQATKGRWRVDEDEYLLLREFRNLITDSWNMLVPIFVEKDFSSLKDANLERLPDAEKFFVNLKVYVERLVEEIEE